MKFVCDTCSKCLYNTGKFFLTYFASTTDPAWCKNFYKITVVAQWSVSTVNHVECHSKPTLYGVCQPYTGPSLGGINGDICPGRPNIDLFRGRPGPPAVTWCSTVSIDIYFFWKKFVLWLDPCDILWT